MLEPYKLFKRVLELRLGDYERRKNNLPLVWPIFPVAPFNAAGTQEDQQRVALGSRNPGKDKSIGLTVEAGSHTSTQRTTDVTVTVQLVTSLDLINRNMAVGPSEQDRVEMLYDDLENASAIVGAMGNVGDNGKNLMGNVVIPEADRLKGQLLLNTRTETIAVTETGFGFGITWTFGGEWIPPKQPTQE